MLFNGHNKGSHIDKSATITFGFNRLPIKNFVLALIGYQRFYFQPKSHLRSLPKHDKFHVYWSLLSLTLLGFIMGIGMFFGTW